MVMALTVRLEIGISHYGFGFRAVIAVRKGREHVHHFRGSPFSYFDTESGDDNSIWTRSHQLA